LICPCNNQPTDLQAGCNALTNPGPAPTGGASLQSSGNATPYDVGSDTLQFTVSGMPIAATESALLIQGPVQIQPVQFGQGLRCVGGSLKRMTPAHITSSGSACYLLRTVAFPASVFKSSRYLARTRW
jgi:hypothetical protein